MSDKITKKVTGIGGVFFKCKNPNAMKKWYNKNLGLKTDDYGSPFAFRNYDRPDEVNFLQWSPMTEDTVYFKPSEKQFMINYRVENIEELIENLKSEGVEIVNEIKIFDYGKFVHIMDPEGNKIELWEPVDKIFVEMYGEKDITH